MLRAAGLAAVLSLALLNCAAAQDVGPIDGRVGGPVGGPVGNSGISEGRRSGYAIQQGGCYKDGVPVSQSYCESVPVESPYPRATYDATSRCAPGSYSYDPGTRTFSGYDGVRRSCY